MSVTEAAESQSVRQRFLDVDLRISRAVHRKNRGALAVLRREMSQLKAEHPELYADIFGDGRWTKDHQE